MSQTLDEMQPPAGMGRLDSGGGPGVNIDVFVPDGAAPALPYSGSGGVEETPQPLVGDGGQAPSPPPAAVGPIRTPVMPGQAESRFEERYWQRLGVMPMAPEPEPEPVVREVQPAPAPETQQGGGLSVPGVDAVRRFGMGVGRTIAQNLMDTAADLGNVLRTPPGTLGALNDVEMAEWVADEPRLRAPQLPQVPSSGETEDALRNFTAYLATFAATGGFRPLIGIGARVMSGAAADLTQNPEEGTIVTLLREMGVGSETLLPLDPQAAARADQRLRARLMQAGEGAGVGLAVEGVIQAVRAIRANPAAARALLALLAGGAAAGADGAGATGNAAAGGQPGGVTPSVPSAERMAR